MKHKKVVLATLAASTCLLVAFGEPMAPMQWVRDLIARKVDIPEAHTNGNLVAFDESGNIKDSGLRFERETVTTNATTGVISTNTVKIVYEDKFAGQVFDMSNEDAMFDSMTNIIIQLGGTYHE